MDSRENLRLIIDEYFSITGRPVSTMTVNEYAGFLKIAGNNSFSFISDGHHCKENNPVSTIPAGIPATSTLSRINLPENSPDADPGNGSDVLAGKEPDMPSLQPVSEIKRNTGKPTKEEMLKIMRSVNS
ncbi:MAG: hypothetical protein ACI4FX_03155 [Agathobacter sp.]